MARRKTLAPGLVAALLVVLGILVGLPVNVVSDYLPESVTASRPAWIGGLAATALLIVVLTLLLPRLVDRRARGASFRVPSRDPEWVDRPELATVAEALRRRSAPVGLTAGIVGAGGFGKTALAVEVCHRRDVRRWFKDGIIWVTVGRDRVGAELASLINDAVAHLDGDRPEFADPEQAGHRLAGSLAGRGRVLLVVDDVWNAAQLDPFLPAAAQAQLLVTTRRPSVVAGTKVEVDEMSPETATRLLTRDLPAMRADLVRDLLRVTGRWPLLLTIVNARLREQRTRGAEVNAAAEGAIRALTADGPATFDVTVTGERVRAVSATIQYSLEWLTAEECERFHDLGALPEDADVPAGVVALLWGCPAAEAERLCERLHELSLLALHWAEGAVAVVTIHDVVRGYLRSASGPAALATANLRLVGQARALAPEGWWTLPPGTPYLRDNLAFHLREAGLEEELDALVTDVRWLVPRAAESGLAAARADLERAPSALARRIVRLISGFGHLLASTSDLLTRLGAIQGMQASVTRYAEEAGLLFMPARWPLPEDDSPHLLRLLPGHTAGVTALAIEPRGAWLATGESGGPKWPANYSAALGVVRVWNLGDDLHVTLGGHRGGVSALAVAPDGTWLAVGDGSGFDAMAMEHSIGAVRLWTPEGEHFATLDGHADMVTAIAIAPDGTWLVTGDQEDTLRIWSREGNLLTTFTSHAGSSRGGVSALAISPDGSWLASVHAGGKGAVEVLRADGVHTGTLGPYGGEVTALAISPDSAWFAVGDGHGGVRTWSTDLRPFPAGRDLPGGCHSLAISPDGSWLVAGGGAGEIRVQDREGNVPSTPVDPHDARVTALAVAPDGTWFAGGDASGTVLVHESDGRRRARLTGHTGSVTHLAITPDSSRLASASRDNGAVRIWDTHGATHVRTVRETRPVTALATAADGPWFVVGDYQGRVRVWDAGGRRRSEAAAHAAAVSGLAIAPDGTWFATAAHEEDVRLWSAQGEPRATLTGSGARALTIAPDGTWLATAGNGGQVRMWTAAGEPRGTLTAHSRDVSALAIAPDGTWFATAAHGQVRIWDAGGALRDDLDCHPQWTSTLVVAPDGAWLAACGDGKVQVWDADGDRRAAFGGEDSWNCAKIALSPDGAWLATAGRGGLVRIWDPDGHEHAHPPPHQDEVIALAISPDGAWLATGGRDRLIKLWDGSREVTLRTAEEITGLAWLADGSTLCARSTQGLYVLGRPHPATR
ncbi:NB-ARC domain-containing protein [Sphaerisporangium aureirubrum]|uniref:NB-ARC domain-containing protein n=1 Tax=Sphaerisporangium aureirubrum TaxID=1544736 RepID=A0ABW1NLR1_9ACTN